MNNYTPEEMLFIAAYNRTQRERIAAELLVEEYRAAQRMTEEERAAELERPLSFDEVRLVLEFRRLKTAQN